MQSDVVLQAAVLERDELKVENEQQYRMHNERIMNARKENIATSNSLQEEHARKCAPCLASIASRFPT